MIFGAVYEHFSFGVYSNYMIYAFAAPLVLGVLPFLLFAIRKLGRAAHSDLTATDAESLSSPTAESLWHTGVATLTVGSVFKGVLDIYGTTSSLTPAYWIAGGALLLAALILSAALRSRLRRNPLPREDALPAQQTPRDKEGFPC